MPELPDVEMMRRYFDATALHKTVSGVEVGDDYVLKRTTSAELREALNGGTFEETSRHGKNMFVELDEGTFLRLHFGMTGNLDYFKDRSQAHKHTRILLDFQNGYHLAYVCQRKLGRVSLPRAPESFVEMKGLGPDAARVSRGQFMEVMRGRRGMLKTTLMNQRIVAGLGNVYTDEVMFQAYLHPTTTMDQLSAQQKEHLYQAMTNVLRTSLERGADARDMPDGWLILHRGEDETCPRCGGGIGRLRIGQRSCYFCPDCQPPVD